MALSEILNSTLIIMGAHMGVQQESTKIVVNPTPQKGWVMYSVKPGDTLSGIAQRYGSSQDAIRWSNSFRGTKLRQGQDLKIPLFKDAGVVAEILPPGFKKHTTHSKDSFKSISKTYEKSLVELVSVNPEIKTLGRLPSGTEIYIPGKVTGSLVRLNGKSTLLSISKKYGVSVANIAKANKLKSLSDVKDGKLLVIPGILAQKEFTVLYRKHLAEIRKEKLEAVRKAKELAKRRAEEAAAARKTEAAAQKAKIAAAAQARAVSARRVVASAPARVRQVNYAVAASGYRQPVSYIKITTYFGTRGYRQRYHAGVDFATSYGTPIYAARAGTIEHASWSSNGYGLNVKINHGGAQESLYGHMSRIIVGRGQWVQRGQVIGYVGSTGMSTGPHLHFEIRVGGVARNPLAYLF